MRISDWSSDVCSSDLYMSCAPKDGGRAANPAHVKLADGTEFEIDHGAVTIAAITSCTNTSNPSVMIGAALLAKKAVEKGLQRKPWVKTTLAPGSKRSEEHTSELQSLMRISYAVFCLKKKQNKK